MANAEVYVEMLHANPEALPGVPSNAEIIEANEQLVKAGVTDLRPLIRQGFLEMWHMGHVRGSIKDLDNDTKHALRDEVYQELGALQDEERRISDLRFILNSIGPLRPKAQERQFEGPYRKERPETPWDMPHEIFWDVKGGATVRRAQWAVDNRPDVLVSDITHTLVLQPEQIKQLDMSSRTKEN